MKVIVHGVSRFSRAFWLSWLVKALLPALYRKLRNKHTTLIDHDSIKSAAVLAAFFTAYRCGERKWGAAVSAAIASSVFVLEPEAVRRPWAQYLSVRVLMAGLKANLSKQSYMVVTVLLFMAAITELMYGVVVRPDCGDGLLRWLCMTGAMPSEEAMRETRRLIKEHDYETCLCIHAKEGCVERIMNVYFNVFKTVLPLNLVLAVLSSFKSGSISVGDAVRSTVFSASCVTAYQVILCVHGLMVRRGVNVLPQHRYVYAAFGTVASLCVFLEKSERRPEVAVFVPSILYP